jgi:hypothetical protein
LISGAAARTVLPWGVAGSLSAPGVTAAGAAHETSKKESVRYYLPLATSSFDIPIRLPGDKSVVHVSLLDWSFVEDFLHFYLPKSSFCPLTLVSVCVPIPESLVRQALCEVERGIMAALDRHYADVLLPVSTGSGPKMAKVVAKLRRKQQPLYVVPHQVSALAGWTIWK